MRKLWAVLASHPVVTAFVLFLLGLVAAYWIPEMLSEARWRAYEREARARGVKFYREEFETPEIPGAENFATISAFQSPDLFALPGYSLTAISAEKGIDWRGWQRFFLKEGWIKNKSAEPVRDVLLALDRFSPLIAEWDEGLKRPQTRFTDFYTTNISTSPSRAVFHQAITIFRFRALVHLELGDSATAIREWQRMLHSSHRIPNIPGEFGSPSRMAAYEALFDTAGYGLRKRVWSDLDLQRIQVDLATIDYAAEREILFTRAVPELNAFYEYLVDAAPWERAPTLALGNSEAFRAPPKWEVFVSGFIPGRAIRENQRQMIQWLEELRTVNKLEKVSMLLNLQTGGPIFRNAEGSLANFFANSGAQVGQAELSRLCSQTTREMTRIACALERFWTAQGRYPEQLAELVPSWLAELPIDPLSEKPLIYRRKAEGGYLLYSVGKNGEDNGGKTGHAIDQVWPYSPAD